MTTSNLYPFMTKATIVAKLADSETFRNQAMIILLNLQTAHEQSVNETIVKNRQGFMSSHAVHGTRIAKALVQGAELSDEDRARVSSIAPRYSRQLAVHFRAQAIAERPELAAVAGIFSAAPKGMPVQGIPAPTPSSEELSEMAVEGCDESVIEDVLSAS
jgi:hypothetical protein